MLSFHMEAKMKKRFSEEQIIGILREGEVDGVVIRDICRKPTLPSRRFSIGDPGLAA
ncbi:hypothetical protein C8R31_10652 [Nitrosospira sp. Nsp2]|nr:hypothetical protein C8R31_10652 [Nitrosospira sp. Nsp2]